MTAKELAEKKQQGGEPESPSGGKRDSFSVNPKKEKSFIK